MKRLTARNEDGSAYYVACFEPEAPCGSGDPGPACADCPVSRQQCEALAAYEETVGDLEGFGKVFTEQSVIQLAGQALGVTPQRLRELAKADAEGCVKIYTVKSNDRCCGNCDNFQREPGTRHGTCKVRPWQSDRYGLDKSRVFQPPQSHVACGSYTQKVDQA